MRSKIALIGVCIILIAIGLSIYVDSFNYEETNEITPNDLYYLHLVIQPGANVTVTYETLNPSPIYQIGLGFLNSTGYDYLKNLEKEKKVQNTEVTYDDLETASEYFRITKKWTRSFKLQTEYYALAILNLEDVSIRYFLKIKAKWRPFAQLGMFLSVGGVLITFTVLLQSRRQKLEVLHIKQPFSRTQSER